MESNWQHREERTSCLKNFAPRTFPERNNTERNIHERKIPETT
jgi:hypothetical protein